MNKVEKQREDRSAWRWLLAGVALWILIPISFGAFYLFAILSNESFAGNDAAMVVAMGMLLAIGAGIAGLACIITGTILHVSSSSRPG